jgi:hypothetical protein
MLIHQSVSSSNLLSVAFDASAKILEVEFREGGVYQYHNVPESVYLSLLNSSSKGKYFNTHIKNTYKWKKIM